MELTELILEGLLNDDSASLPFRGTYIIPIVGSGDVNGIVDGSDYSEVISYWGQSSPTGPPAAIPEPATVLLLGIGSLALMRRKRA